MAYMYAFAQLQGTPLQEEWSGVSTIEQVLPSLVVYLL